MAETYVNAQDLTAETSGTLDGNEYFVMFDGTQGKKASLNTIKTYIAGDLGGLGLSVVDGKLCITYTT